MPRDNSIKKVLVIGSGPIVIGQAAEFDYAGTQACRSLKEEGIEVVLLNSNPATIMTDKDIADRVYIEPLTIEVVEQLIKKEKPDSVLPTLGGQAGLNLAMELEEAGFLKENNVRLIGTTSETIKKAEDRLEFKATMEKIGEPVAASLVVENVEDGLAFANKIGYPVVLRPAYTLGGSGGGIAHDSQQLVEILENGLRLSRVGQVLVERCIAGWKEIEYEVMRDGAGNCITVCNMENIDPVGVHTGDSIVVAPSQTLGDKEYQMLRTSALNIISELNITGGCNVQYALHPETFEYCVIEVNPRVSRSSALASKATGYPIAKVAAKIALGYNLDEIKNAITQKTYASFEPMLDYVVVKIPRLPFDKFISAKRTLTTQMKATGEVMSICNNFEGALMKAIRSLEQHVDSLMSYDFTDLTDDELIDQLKKVDDMRMWRIAEACRRGISYDLIHEITKVDEWFIDKFAIITEMETALKTQELTPELLKEAKRIEFPDNVIAELTGKTEQEIHDMRHENGIVAAYKIVDTCAAEFAAETPYYYSVYGSENEGEKTAKGDSIYRYYSKNEDKLKEQIAEFDNKVQEALKGQEGTLTSDIKLSEIKLLENQLDEKIALLNKTSDISKITEYKKEINDLVSKKAKLTGESSAAGSYLKQLYNQRAKLEEQLNSGAEYIKAPESGIVSYKVDGLEETLTPNNFSTINKEFLENLKLKTGQLIATNDECGKIIDSSKCYIATISNSEQAKQAQIGDSVKVRLSNSKVIKATITYTSQESEEETLIILEINKQISELANYRKISFDLIWWNETGLKVPNQAIVEENGFNYVVRNRAGYLDKILVNVTRKNDKYSIVTNYSTDELKNLGFSSTDIQKMKSISIYDELILNPDLSKAN